ncbi:MAG TPA: YihY/virulence factor BrkB family protein [Thermomicrobiales bacterium]|jgi:membrane protein|nr:YihY/virulence factor BrkB family protein [Thermomicrobiales bacterium]
MVRQMLNETGQPDEVGERPRGRVLRLNTPWTQRPLRVAQEQQSAAGATDAHPAGSSVGRPPLSVTPAIPAVDQPHVERTGWAYVWHSTKRHAHAFRRYFSIRNNDLAAMVAFNGLIAVVPMFLLVVAIVGLLLQDEGLFREFRRAVISVFPSQGARDALMDASATRDNVGWFSLLSLVGFAWIGSSFVATVTRAINSLYEVRGSPFVRSRIRAVFVIIAFSLLLMIVVLAATLPTLLINREVNDYFEDVEDLFLFQVAYQILSYAISLVFAFLLFVIAYRYLPAVRQRFRDVVPGALVAAVGLVLLMQVFPIYVRVYQALPSSSSYGAAFVFVSILVTWAYLLAHVLLIGAWLNARAEERRRLHRSVTITHLEPGSRAHDVPIQRTPLAEPPPLPSDSVRAPAAPTSPRGWRPRSRK